MASLRAKAAAKNAATMSKINSWVKNLTSGTTGQRRAAFKAANGGKGSWQTQPRDKIGRWK